MRTILVCGGRDYANAENVDATLSLLHYEVPTLAIIQGGASGVDELARSWAKLLRVPCETFAADWRTHGRKAGPLRNQRMLEEGKPDVVVAFPGGRGTADMVRRAKVAGVPVIEVVDG